jgi:hypothetical protein
MTNFGGKKNCGERKKEEIKDRRKECPLMKTYRDMSSYHC